jgi:adenylosuccinate synthase
MSVTVLVGGQFGSEGKGKIAGYLASECDVSIRTGGPNAGHSVEQDGKFYKLQSVPCAFINPQCLLCIGAGGIIDISILEREIKECGLSPERLVIDPKPLL